MTNTGKVAGDEVVQLYLSFPDVKGAPIRALRGFHRIHLDAGASQKVEFTLKPRDLSMVTEVGEPIVAGGEYKVSVGGGQPDTGAPTVSGNLPDRRHCIAAGITMKVNSERSERGASLLPHESALLFHRASKGKTLSLVHVLHSFTSRLHPSG